VEAGGFEPPSENEPPWASPSAARVFFSKVEAHGQASTFRAFPGFPDPDRKAEPRPVGRFSHALIQSPTNSGEDGRLFSIRRREQQVRRHLFFSHLFYEVVGTSARFPKGLIPVEPIRPLAFINYTIGFIQNIFHQLLRLLKPISCSCILNTGSSSQKSYLEHVSPLRFLDVLKILSCAESFYTV